VTNIILPGDIEQPRIVTFAELVTTVAPVLASWGLTSQEAVWELHDLWSMGAPAPDTAPGMSDNETRRILIHTQFNKWWREAMARHGMTVTPRQAFYG